VVQNSALVKQKIEDSKMAAKCAIGKRNPELCAATRAKKAKVERDEERAKTLASLEKHNHSQVLRLHDEKKPSCCYSMIWMNNYIQIKF
jgi:uncharacterized protein YaiL (DUF2058 family)